MQSNIFTYFLLESLTLTEGSGMPPSTFMPQNFGLLSAPPQLGAPSQYQLGPSGISLGSAPPFSQPPLPVCFFLLMTKSRLFICYKICLTEVLT